MSTDPDRQSTPAQRQAPSAQDDIVRARSGDRAALGRLIERMQDRLRQTARGRKGTRFTGKLDVSDLVQSGCVRLIEHIGDFRGTTEAEFEAWAMRILEMRINERYRFLGAAKRRDVWEPTSTDPQAMEIDTPSARSSRAEELAIVRDALTRLAPDHAEVIRLRVAEGRSHEEIARTMGRSEVAVRSLLSRARAALALELEAPGVRTHLPNTGA